MLRMLSASAAGVGSRCGCRFAPQARPAPAARQPEQYAPDEMCRRCCGVLLPAAQFDTSGLLGGIDSGAGGAALGGRTGREIAGTLGFMDMLAQMALGGIQAKLFQRRLQRTLQEAPHSLCCPACCPACRTIVRR